LIKKSDLNVKQAEIDKKAALDTQKETKKQAALKLLME
jgi:hypothetical protein